MFGKSGKAVFLALCIGLLLLLYGCGGNEQQTEQQQEFAVPAQYEQAYSIYKQNCVACHGGELQGRIGPSLQHVGTNMDKSAITDKIAAGGNGMPEFRLMLEQDEIAALADWLASLK